MSSSCTFKRVVVLVGLFSLFLPNPLQGQAKRGDQESFERLAAEDPGYASCILETRILRSAKDKVQLCGHAAWDRAVLKVRMNALLLPKMRLGDHISPFWPIGLFPERADKSEFGFVDIAKSIKTVGKKYDSVAAKRRSADSYAHALFINVRWSDFQKQSLNDQIAVLSHIIDGIRLSEWHNGINPDNHLSCLVDLYRLVSICLLMESQPLDGDYVQSYRVHVPHLYFLRISEYEVEGSNLLSVEQCLSIYRASFEIRRGLARQYERQGYVLAEDIKEHRKQITGTSTLRNRPRWTRKDAEEYVASAISLQSDSGLRFDGFLRDSFDKSEEIFWQLTADLAAYPAMHAAWARLSERFIKENKELGVRDRNWLLFQSEYALKNGQLAKSYSYVGEAFSRFVYSLISPPGYYSSAVFSNRIRYFKEDRGYVNRLRSHLRSLRSQEYSSQEKTALDLAIAYLEGRTLPSYDLPRVISATDSFANSACAIHQRDGKESVRLFVLAADAASTYSANEACLALAIVRACNPSENIILAEQLLRVMTERHNSPWAIELKRRSLHKKYVNFSKAQRHRAWDAIRKRYRKPKSDAEVFGEWLLKFGVQIVLDKAFEGKDGKTGLIAETTKAALFEGFVSAVDERKYDFTNVGKDVAQELVLKEMEKNHPKLARGIRLTGDVGSLLVDLSKESQRAVSNLPPMKSNTMRSFPRLEYIQ